MFNTKNEFWKKVQSNIIFIAFTELLIYNVGLLIVYSVRAMFDPFTPLVGEKFGMYYNLYFWIIIPIIMTLVFMKLTCRRALRVFTEGSFKKKLGSWATGFALGFLCIAILDFVGYLSGTMTIVLGRFNWRILPMLPLVFIQSSAEEMLLRGYVPAVMKEKHSWDTICFVSGTLFIFHHILNMIYSGFETLFCLNIFLMGVLYCLYVEWAGNFWISSGAHTGWNYTLLCLIGPGEKDDFPGIIGGTARSNSWFYSKTSGFQGTVATAVLLTVLVLLMIYTLHVRAKSQTGPGDGTQASIIDDYADIS